MVGIDERVKTTRNVTTKINAFLNGPEPDYISALLIAELYLNIRLRTLLTNWISPTENRNWKKISNQVINHIPFPTLLRLCKDNDLLPSEDDVEKIRKIHIKRNDIAHYPRLWNGVKDKSEQKEFREFCKFTQDFLERTN
ncbi:MAG: hypothetical protein NWF02_09295 [Candidatus Bathyarchaeota archaeon]|nr:hypothetical protein [Candidatus Bathyarchaeum sp.]